MVCNIAIKFPGSSLKIPLIGMVPRDQDAAAALQQKAASSFWEGRLRRIPCNTWPKVLDQRYEIATRIVVVIAVIVGAFRTQRAERVPKRPRKVFWNIVGPTCPGRRGILNVFQVNGFFWWFDG